MTGTRTRKKLLDVDLHPKRLMQGIDPPRGEGATVSDRSPFPENLGMYRQGGTCLGAPWKQAGVDNARLSLGILQLRLKPGPARVTQEKKIIIKCIYAIWHYLARFFTEAG